MKEAEEFCTKVFEGLDRDKNAIGLRDLLEEIAEQGKLINLIESELRKR